MTRRLFAVITLTSLALAGACAPEPAPESEGGDATPAADLVDAVPPGVDPDVPEDQLARAREVASALMGDLKGELVAALKEGGPAEAIEICAHRAPEIAAEHAGEGLSARRVSLKVRNPADEPDAYEKAKLQMLHGLHEKDAASMPDELAEVVEKGEQAPLLRYMKPIEVSKPCLACHGDPEEIAPAVKDRLRELYPGDEATGYDVGDLRGAVSVTIDLSKTGSKTEGGEGAGTTG